MPRSESNRIEREPGDDIDVLVRFRRSAFYELTGPAGLRVNGTMQLVDQGVIGGIRTYAVCVWSAAMPDWPDPVPGNTAAKVERTEKRVSDA